MGDLQERILPVAPTLAAALQGPFADVAMKYLTDKIVGEKIAEGKSSEEDLAEMLKVPENLHMLKTVDKNFAQEMKNLNIDIFKLELQDRTNARAQAKSDNRPQAILSVLFLIAYFSILISMFYVEVSDSLNMSQGENSLMGELQILLGVLSAGVGQILNFWFGGSVKKESNQ